jgi:hypothetical protein
MLGCHITIFMRTNVKNLAVYLPSVKEKKNSFNHQILNSFEKHKGPFI